MIIHTFYTMSKKLAEMLGGFHGTSSLGERGQVVIPKELRESLQLKKGEKFLVMEKHGAIMLAPVDMMSQFVTGLSKELKKTKK